MFIYCRWFGGRPIERALSCLASSKRDIDVLGWYKANQAGRNHLY